MFSKSSNKNEQQYPKTIIEKLEISIETVFFIIQKKIKFYNCNL